MIDKSRPDKKLIDIEGLDLSITDVQKSEGIFLSYASQDRYIAKMIVKDLSFRGLNVWYDQWDSKVGKPVAGMLEKGIENKEWFIVLISKHSLKSKWVQLEIETAGSLNEEFGLPKILLCVLDQAELPDWISNTVFADFRKDYRSGFTKLLESLTDTEIKNEYKAIQQLDSHRSKAGILFRQGKYTESIKLYQECVAMFESAKGKINLSLGQIAFNQCKFEESFKLFKRGYTIFRKEGDLRGETHALQFLSHYFAMFGKKRQAIIYLNRLLDRTKEKEIHNWNIMRKGMIEIEYGFLNRSRKTFLLALKAFEKSKNEFGISATKYLLARERICSKDYQSALQLLNKAMVYSKNTEDPKGISYTLLRQAQAFIALGQYDEAIKHLKELITVLLSDPDPNLFLEAERIITKNSYPNISKENENSLQKIADYFNKKSKSFSALAKLRKVIKADDRSVLIEGM